MGGAMKKILAFLLLGIVNPGHAVQVTVNADIPVLTVFSELSPFFSVGDQISVSLTYDSSVPPSFIGSEARSYNNAIMAASLQIGSFSAQLAPAVTTLDNEIQALIL